MKFKFFLKLVGVVQIILGLLYLIIPQQLLHMMGHSTPLQDINYPLGMLAARFIAYGLAMFYMAKAPFEQKYWINNMILIQFIDLSVGVFYTLNGTLSLTLSGFPMFNATMIGLVLWFAQPKQTEI